MKAWERKELVRTLRRRGLSYREIAGELPISKSSISAWCRDIELTDAQIARLAANSEFGSYIGQLRGARVNKIKRLQEIEKIKSLSGAEISDLSYYDFKIAGLMLYWAEGSKRQFVDFSNSDVDIIKFIMGWFRKICLVPDKKFRVQLHIYSGQDEIKTKKYWSEVTGIPVAQFIKSYIKKEGSGHRKNRLYNGTIEIRVCDSNLLHKILGWIDKFKTLGGAASSIGRAPAS